MEFFIGAETYTFTEILSKEMEGSIDLIPISSKDYQKVLNLLGNSFSSVTQIEKKENETFEEKKYREESEKKNEQEGLKLMASEKGDILITQMLTKYGSNIQGIDIVVKREPLEKRVATIKDLVEIGVFFNIRFSIFMFLFNLSTLKEKDIEKVKKP